MDAKMDVEDDVDNDEESSSESSDSKVEKSDDDDENDAADEETEKKICELQQAISANLYSYNPHVELIKLLRKNGDLDQLNTARERMSSVFPLSVELWLEWLQDEVKYAESADRPKIISLFERAVKDYTSVAIWLEYVQYSIGGMAEEGGMEMIRNVFEQAITAVGINAASGSMLWEAYREFESALLAGLQPAPGSVATSDALKNIEAQTTRITNLFRRQLSVPLINMENTLQEYKEWIDGEVDTATQKTYDKAFARLKEILPFENDLLNSDPPHLTVYNSYIEHEVKVGDPVRVTCVYERAVTDNCLVSDLWLRYVRYVEATLKSRHAVLPLYERAIRNCPWSVDLWIGFMLALENFQQPHDQIVDAFNRALASGFTQGSEFLRLWTAYLDYLRRRINWSEGHDKELEALRYAFEQATWHLNQNYPLDGDPNCSITQYWAFIEAKYCQNMSKARELWSGILQSGFGSQAVMCLEYVRLERAYGDQKHCRKLLQRIVSSVSDWPESVCEEYIKYEREEGDLASYHEAVQRCEAQLKRVQERRAKEAEKEAELAEQKKAERAEKKKQTKNKKQSVSKPFHDTQKASQVVQPEVRPYARSRPPPGAPQQKASDSSAAASSMEPMETSKSLMSPNSAVAASATVYVRGQKRKLPEESETSSEAPTDNTAGRFKVPPPPGYKPPTSTQTSETVVKKAKVDNGSADQGDSADHTNTAARKTSQSTRPPDGAINGSCTIFVSNLDFSVTKPEIEEIFSKVGELKEVRLITNFKGRSKGFAYVEFKDELAAMEALKLDREPLSGRPMFVSSYTMPGEDAPKIKFNLGLEKNKLFIKGIPKHMTKKELEELFAPHGKLKDARIVTYRNGAPKGIAYVEYENEASAAQAVLKLDGYVIDDQQISVAISNPPARNAPQFQRNAPQHSDSFVPSLGGGKKLSEDHSKARTQLMLPRALKRQPAAAAESDNTSGGQEQPMSNQDFRNMLLH